MAQLRWEQIVRRMVRRNVPHAGVATFWWATVARKTNALVTMVLEREEQIVRQMVKPNAFLAAVATPIWGPLVKKINALALMALQRWEQVAL